jgi:ribonuclease D
MVYKFNLITKKQLKPNHILRDMYTYIDTNEELKEICDELEKEAELGIDLECENNLHHYGAYISLIQISNKSKNYVVDILKVTDVKPLIKILEDKNIQKIFHGSDFDMRMLNSQFNCKPKNIFDTQVAALLLGKKDIGLGHLIQEYFNVEKIKKFQKADWTRRPLTVEMLDYASGDTIYLVRLRDVLIKELKEKGRLEWAEEDLLLLEKKEWIYEEGKFNTVKGYSHLEPKEKAIFKRLYDLRNDLAKKVDRPIHFVINNKQLIGYTVEPPKDWSRVRGVHPIIRKNAKLFSIEIQKGSKEKIEIEKREIKKLSLNKKAQLDQLELFQVKLAEELEIMKYLIMNKEQMIAIVVSESLDGLKNWQKKLVEEEWKRISAEIQ